MTDINDLRERVEAAEHRFGLMDEQQRHYSERVIGLIETIEGQLAAARGEIEKQIDENLRLSQENEELRTMLHSVLRSIEEKTFTRTLQNLESRVSALVAGAGAATAGVAGIDAAAVGEAAGAESPVGEVPARLDAVIEAAEPDTTDADDAVIVEAEETAAGAEGVGMPEEMSAGQGGAEDIVAEAVAAEDAFPEDLAAEDMAVENMPAEDAAAEDGGAAAENAPAGAAAPEEEGEVGGEQSEADDSLFDAMTALSDVGAALAEASTEEVPAAEVDAETPAPDAADAPTEVEGPPEGSVMADAPAEIAAEAAAPSTDEADGGAAPTVKEIIRRVGDLARELERTEAVRRASSAGQETGDEETGDEETGGEETGDEEMREVHPPLGQAANG